MLRKTSSNRPSVRNSSKRHPSGWASSASDRAVAVDGLVRGYTRADTMAASPWTTTRPAAGRAFQLWCGPYRRRSCTRKAKPSPIHDAPAARPVSHWRPPCPRSMMSRPAAHGIDFSWDVGRKMIALSRPKRFSNCRISCFWFGSNPSVGSSSTRIGGSWIRDCARTGAMAEAPGEYRRTGGEHSQKAQPHHPLNRLLAGRAMRPRISAAKARNPWTVMSL